MDVLLWALGLLVVILTAVLGFLAKAQWAHITECRVFRAEFATVKEKVAAIEREIGDHESGIRGSIHDLRNQVSPFAIWAQMQMTKQGDQR